MHRKRAQEAGIKAEIEQMVEAQRRTFPELSEGVNVEVERRR